MSELNTNPAGGEPAPATEPAGDPTTQATQPPGTTFTQEQVNGLVTKESRRQMEKLLQEVGLSTDGDYKAQLDAFKKWTDSQKTEAQIAAEQAEQARKDLEAERANAAKLQMQIAAMSRGVPADKADKYIALSASYNGEDFAAKLDAALADFPIAIPQGQAPVQQLPSFAAKTQPKPDSTTLDDYKKMTYSEKLALKDENPSAYEQFKKQLGFK